jgi:GT2 family glycosyltransferase
MNIDVTIIIVNYNTKDLLKDCLSSIYEKTVGLEYEIVVVDNASIDGSKQMVKNEFPDVKLIESKENLGFGRANNLGIINSKGKYIFLLNSDTILLNNAILIFYNYMEEHNSNESIGAIGGLLLDVKENPTFSFGEFPNTLSELRYIKRKIAEKILKTKPFNFSQFKNHLTINVEFITGADLFIPKKVIEKIGLFDQQFFMYYEETDLQKRMADEGFRRLIIVGPKIVHLEGGSFSSPSKLSYPNFSLNQKSLHIYMKKHFAGFDYVIFRIIMILLRSMIVFDRRLSSDEKVKAIKLIVLAHE